MEEISIASASVDHMISLTIFMAAILIFIGLFSQTMQTGITYELHAALSTKTSDLLDTILLNPGLPVNWSQRDDAIVGFGLQNPDFSQYKLSSISPMRLTSFAQSPVYYPRTGTYYSNNSAGIGTCLLAPTAKSFNYSIVSKLLGVNGTYGFQFTLSPTITVSIEKISTGAPLKLLVNAAGTGYPLANAPLSYSLIVVNQNANNYPSYSMTNGVAATDPAGFAQLSFSGIDGESQSYALIVYSHLNGLKGMGYYVHELPSFTKTIVPLIDSFQNRTIIIAHGDSVGQPPQAPTYSLLSYNASFVLLTEEYTLRQVALDQSSAVGKVFYDSSSGQNFSSVNLPNNDGILIVTYKGASAGQYGLVLVPWGLSSLGFPLTFGGNPIGQDWVTTDIRQVTVGGMSYRVRLELWNLEGYRGVR
jgi:hypothetical protein